MNILQQFAEQTPIWVWVLFAYLVIRGVKARRPGDTTLVKMAIIPVLFTLWALHDLVTLYGFAIDAAAFWFAGIAAGTFIGWSIASRLNIVADRQAGVLHRPADLTLLPLLLVTFAIKYGFGVIASVSPELLALPMFRITDLLLSGLFTGIFVGKFLRYLAVWRAVSAPLAPPSGTRSS